MASVAEQTIRASLHKANRYAKRTLQRIEKDADKLIFVPIIIYTVLFSAYTCYMHYIFKTFAWDLGIITQSLWTTLNSDKMLYSTLEVSYGNPAGNFLGVHFSPILFLILPVYAVYQSPETLLVLQSFVLAMAALPLYWLARDKLGSKLQGLAFASLYLLNPALHGVNTFDFHVEIFTPLFFLFAFYYLEKGAWYKAMPFIILELTTLEFAPAIVFFLGVYFLLKRIIEKHNGKRSYYYMAKRLLLPVLIIVGSLCSFYLALETIAAVNPLKAQGPYREWKYWGGNVYESMANMLQNPVEVIIRLFTPIEKPYFVIFLFSAVLFLPLLAPIELVMTFPWLAVALLTDYQPYYQPYYQYSTLVLGQIFIAGIYGFRRLFPANDLANGSTLARKKVITIMIALNIFLFATISPVGIPAITSRSIRPYAIATGADLNHINKVYDVLNLIPSNASVATIHDIFPHVCQRLHAYFLKWPLDYDVEYIIVDLTSPTLTWGINGPTPDQIVRRLLDTKEYGILASVDGTLLLKRAYNGSIQYFSPQIEVFNCNQLITASGMTKWDYTSNSGKVITSNPENPLGLIWFGPYQYFAPGEYSCTFRMKIANPNCQLLLDVVAERGGNTIIQTIINGTDFRQPGEWQDISIHFRIDNIRELEIRGTSLLNSTQVTLDYVKVLQLEP